MEERAFQRRCGVLPGCRGRVAWDYQAYWALGNCYSELGKPRKAEQSFRQAIPLCPNADKITLLFNLANTLFDQKRYVSAIKLYSEIPTAHPLSIKAKKNVLLAKGRDAEAEA